MLTVGGSKFKITGINNSMLWHTKTHLIELYRKEQNLE